MLNKASEILGVLGLKHTKENGNIILSNDMHYPLTGVIGIDVGFLRDKIFNKLYCDLYEIIENILGLDWTDIKYDRTLSELILDFQVSTFLNSSGNINRFKKFYKDLMFLDFGIESPEYFVPVGIDDINGVRNIKLVSKVSMYEAIKSINGEVDDIVRYKDMVMFTIPYTETSRVKDIVRKLKQLDVKCDIERAFGYLDPAMMTFHVLISILDRNKSIYKETYNNATLLKIVSELKIINGR